ncbi:MAG: hypothetical protein ACLRWQ_03485 [Flavonifractor plautii]
MRRSVLQGCGTSGLVRILLFLAVLGTCAMASGNAATIIAAGNPAAEAFPPGRRKHRLPPCSACACSPPGSPPW